MDYIYSLSVTCVLHAAYMVSVTVPLRGGWGDNVPGCFLVLLGCSILSTCGGPQSSPRGARRQCASPRTIILRIFCPLRKVRLSLLLLCRI